MVDAEYVSRIMHRRYILAGALNQINVAEKNQLAFCLALHAARELPQDKARRAVFDTVSVLAQRSVNFARNRDQYVQFVCAIEERVDGAAENVGDGAQITSETRQDPQTSLRDNMALLLLAYWDEVTAYTMPGPRSEILQAAQQRAKLQCIAMFQEPWAVCEPLRQ
jgi:hypothetical protein